MSYFNVEKISYEGPKSKNPFSFKYYNPEEIVLGKNNEGTVPFCYVILAYFNLYGK